MSKLKEPEFRADIELPAEPEEEIVIDGSNFDDYFFDVRQHSPKKGQIIACYSAVAYFQEGPEKQQMINLVKNTQKAEPASQVMRKLLFASEPDCWRVPREMAQDLLSGMSEVEVEKKMYQYTAQIYYYTMPDCVPDDPHWTTISILNLDKFLSTNGGCAQGLSEENQTRVMEDMSNAQESDEREADD